MSWIKGLLALVVFYLGFLLVNLPAHIVWQQISPQINGVVLTHPKGTIWQGQATQVQVQQQSFDQLHWKLHPLSLITGCIDATTSIEFASNPVTAEISHCLSGITHIEDIKSDMPASVIGDAAGFSYVDVGGLLSVSVDHIETQNQAILALDGKATWQNASIALNETVSLGNLNASFNNTDNGALTANVADDASGPFKINATATLTNGQAFSINGTISARSTASNADKEFLQLLGRPNKQGEYRLTHRGRI